MIGGIGFLVRGNMECGIYKNDLIVRVDPVRHKRLLKKKGVRIFDITGRPIKGWPKGKPAGGITAKHLSKWINEGVTFALTLPPK